MSSRASHNETVKLTRRDFKLLLPMLAAAGARAQRAPLTSRTYRYEDLPVRTTEAARSRAVFDGLSLNGFGIEMHETELAAGRAPHPPHHHVHHEMVVIREGTLEVMISGRGTTLGPGSVAYIVSNEEHGWKNVGTTVARYYIITLGRT